MWELVDKAINEHIRPQLQKDGGDIRLLEVNSCGIVKVRLLGQCSSCPASSHTLASLAEDVIKRKVPSIVKVELETQHVTDELIGEALKILRKGTIRYEASGH